MKIRTKIFALVATLSFVAIVTAAVGINTLQAYNQAVDDVRHAASRAFYGERLNRLVTHVVMEARGIYASKDTKEAQKFGEGLVATLKDIDGLLKEWEPLVPALQQGAVRRCRQGRRRVQDLQDGNRPPRRRGLAHGSERAGQHRCQPRQQEGVPGQHRCSDEARKRGHRSGQPACGRAQGSALHAARLDRVRRYDRRASRRLARRPQADRAAAEGRDRGDPEACLGRLQPAQGERRPRRGRRHLEGDAGLRGCHAGGGDAAAGAGRHGEADGRAAQARDDGAGAELRGQRRRPRSASVGRGPADGGDGPLDGHDRAADQPAIELGGCGGGRDVEQRAGGRGCG